MCQKLNHNNLIKLMDHMITETEALLLFPYYQVSPLSCSYHSYSFKLSYLVLQAKVYTSHPQLYTIVKSQDPVQ